MSQGHAEHAVQPNECPLVASGVDPDELRIAEPVEPLIRRDRAVEHVLELVFAKVEDPADLDRGPARVVESDASDVGGTARVRGKCASGRGSLGHGVTSVVRVRAGREVPASSRLAFCGIRVSMAAQETLQPRKRRGPAPTGKGEPVQVRFQPEQLAALDAWRERQQGTPTRPEAVRQLVDKALERDEGT